jgi:pimeloyl-ACP methyl ester carboxylesterase
MDSFTSDGVRIAYVDLPTAAGHGAPILLIHGFASNHSVNWVYPSWTTTLNRAGFRVVALDNRGHGESDKLYDPIAYATDIMAEDARGLLDHLGIRQADIMGYSMGARIAAWFALRYPERVRSLVLGGIGIRLVEGAGLPVGIADAMEALSREALSDPMQRMFRIFAEQTKSDLKALAACIRGSRQTLTRDEVAQIGAPTLVAVGTKDTVAGPPHELAALMRNAEVLEILGRDHNLAVGDKVHKQGVLDFLSRRP